MKGIAQVCISRIAMAAPGMCKYSATCMMYVLNWTSVFFLTNSGDSSNHGTVGTLQVLQGVCVHAHVCVSGGVCVCGCILLVV